MQQPLAYRMRPKTLEDVVGQQQLVGPGKIIARMVKAKRLSSMILYGPPGYRQDEYRQRHCRLDQVRLPHAQRGHR
jgi:Holliday junction resolvasome RuvABC ATP-dependent DNA helicase subunit